MTLFVQNITVEVEPAWMDPTRFFDCEVKIGDVVIFECGARKSGAPGAEEEAAHDAIRQFAEALQQAIRDSHPD